MSANGNGSRGVQTPGFTTPPSEAIVRAAAIELAAGVVLLEHVAQLAEDFASPGYKPDAGEREEMRKALQRVDTWRTRHAQLLEWAKRTGKRPAARVVAAVLPREQRQPWK